MIRPVIRKIKKFILGARLIPKTICSRATTSRHITASLSLFDVVFTTKSYNCDLGNPEPWGEKGVFVDVPIGIHRPVPVSMETGRRRADGFIGTFEEDRAEKMFFLAKSGIEVRVWGNGWKRWSATFNSSYRKPTNLRGRIR